MRATPKSIQFKGFKEGLKTAYCYYPWLCLGQLNPQSQTELLFLRHQSLFCFTITLYCYMPIMNKDAVLNKLNKKN